MSYWGYGPSECDSGFDAIGVYIILIKKRMYADAIISIENKTSEQGILATLELIRSIAKSYKKCVLVTFNRKDLEKARTLFEKWYSESNSFIPPEYRDKIKEAGDQEFIVFETEVFGI